MKKSCLWGFLCLCCITSFAQQWPTPTTETRAGSRWWWLGSAVNEQELSHSMQEIADHGIKSLEITPIYGVKHNDHNNISFLSPRWMEILRFVEQEGEKDSIQIDMNCGTGWPFGGPTVPLEEATCRVAFTIDSIQGGKMIDLPIKLTSNNIHVASTTEEDGENTLETAQLLKVMAYNQHGQVIDLTKQVKNLHLQWKVPKGDWLLMGLYQLRTKQLVNRAAPGGDGFVIDHFDKQALRHYLDRFDEAFESTHTPWPNTLFNDSYEVYGADWTPTLLQEFEQRRGYKLEHYLPELLLDQQIGNKDIADVLIDYRLTLSEMLQENFTEQWVSWAHSHGVRTRNQAHGSPANLIDLYAAVDIPEIEGFGLSDFGIKGLRTDPGMTRKNYSDLSMLKYAPSASHITGKHLTSCESFTWLTEHFRTSLSQLKPDMDLIFCAGINRMFFHGTVYSPQGDPWPGWKFYASIDMSPTNTIWRDAHWFTDYVERCQSFLQWGQSNNDFLVYLPIRDLWAERRGDLLMMFEISNMDKNAPVFIETVLQIDKLGYDCDYISDQYLLTTNYQDGMLQTSAGTRYRALVLPNVKRLSDEVRAYINQLKGQGAPIIEGVDASEMQRLAKPEAMKRDLKLNAVRMSNKHGYHYFIANLSPDDKCQYVPLAVDFQSAMLFDPMTGKRYMADINERHEVLLDLRSGESIILETFNQQVPDINIHRTRPTSNKKIDLTHGEWTLTFTESQPIVNQSFSLQQLCTWEQLPDASLKTLMGTGIYTRHFILSTEEASHQWMIDLGDVRESARVYINNKLIGCAWAVPFILDCQDALQPGDNEIRIEVTNLPANHIAEMDRQHIPWRKFNNINVVNINYEHITYDQWELVPSGLNSKVCLLPF
ncbi:MAG: glycosyl hydrolase family 2 [Bacteroidaceae bacterium]|nr:glycosyl hydrolase family 2 [Bacteroidaceae bacterium]